MAEGPKVNMLRDAALAQLRGSIQAVIEESKTEIHLLPLCDQLRIGALVLAAAGRGYFAGVDMPGTLAGGYAPAENALRLYLWKAAICANNP